MKPSLATLCWFLLVLFSAKAIPCNARTHSVHNEHTKHSSHDHGNCHEPQQQRNEEYLFYVLRASLTGFILETPSVPFTLGSAEETIQKQYPIDDGKRWVGGDWPLYGYTMTGMIRLELLEAALKDVVANNIPGHFLEAGVWRGGSSIFARAVWNVLGQHDRAVHLADSFSGLPPASTHDDRHIRWHEMEYLQVSQEEVQSNFKRFGLDPNDGVFYHKGFFNESLPIVRKQFEGHISVLRLDGDMYISAMDQLYNLYEFVPIGGWIIIDDYQILPATSKAIHDFLGHHNAQETIVNAHDGNAAHWVKTVDFSVDYEWYAEWCKTRNYEHAMNDK